MKPLYFGACAPINIAPALAKQAHETLRTYTTYLKSAMTAAQGRQERSVCRWEPVPEELRVRLQPKDSLVILRAEGHCYRVDGWEGEPPTIPLFVGVQFKPVQPKRIARQGTATLVWLAEAVPNDATAYWSGRECRLRAMPAAWPARLFARRDGSVATIRRRVEESSRLVLVVEGRAPISIVSETGDVLPHEAVDATEGATKLLLATGSIPWNGDGTVQLPSAPESDVLDADNGTRWEVASDGGERRRRRGVWIQLLAPDDVDPDAATDPRGAYCEEGVREVRVREGKSGGGPCRVWGFRRDSYQLELEYLPPEGSTISLSVNLSGLRRQRQAVYRIKDTPLPHHRGLLRLCEHPDRVRWPRCTPVPVSEWYVLDDPNWNGTDEQRAFVQRALGTEDFAFLEGPPGSGKTHAICELVLQLVTGGKRVLLCSTTHVAVDNVLERLVRRFEQVEAVRIGKTDKVDIAVRRAQIDERVDELVVRWRETGTLAELDDEALERAAESAILASVNLTCGTTTGILAHPYIRRTKDDDAGPNWPHFDVLILDEASKTTFQEFLVPAQLARKWIVVGDVHQLPPFTETKDLEASLAEVNEEVPGGSVDGARRHLKMPPAYQRALLLMFRLRHRDSAAGQVRRLIEERDEVLDAIALEIRGRSDAGRQVPSFVRIRETAEQAGDVSVEQLGLGEDAALRLLAVDWVLVPTELRSRVERWLPADAVPIRAPSGATRAAYRFDRWQRLHGRLVRPVGGRREKCETAGDVMNADSRSLSEQTWASEVAWRIGRVHQLPGPQNEQQRRNRQDEVDDLMPFAAPLSGWVPSAVVTIRDVGVRSVIEALRVPREDHHVRRPSALTEAVPVDVWTERAVLLTYQHRMHPQISRFPRERFYDSLALTDANTLDGRDARVGWGFMPSAPSRCVWHDVRGREERSVNVAEVEAMHGWLKEWARFSERNPRKDDKPWEVACLSFYNRQELAIRDMLRRLTGKQRGETRFELPGTTVVCATVDRFQGREADFVLLSLRNTSRPGHMDSPNRLNVGVTRARYFLVVVGNHEYFSSSRAPEDLEQLAKAPRYVPGGAS